MPGWEKQFTPYQSKNPAPHWLDNMLDAAPGGLLRVNRGSDVNRLTDLLTFISNAILKSGKQIFGIRKPSKFNVPG